jgi:thiamine biosynthesis lipoprotein
MRVDLGGIAKGHAVDRAIAALKDVGVKNALVDAGGDGYALGTRLDGTPWRVGVQDPDRPGDRRQLKAILTLSNVAYATSGDYQQYVEIGGERYAHIIDPRTGQPARLAASVTVIAPDCTTADALATAVSVLGPDAGIKLVEGLPGVECLVITRDADGLKRSASSGFGAFVTK